MTARDWLDQIRHGERCRRCGVRVNGLARALRKHYLAEHPEWSTP